jgi:hypothetical protein
LSPFMSGMAMKADRLAVLRAEAETIFRRLKVTDEPCERKILLCELRQIWDRLGSLDPRRGKPA